MNNKGFFSGKVAFVTGAANGIGRATALASAREGASVVVADVSEQGNQATARMIAQEPVARMGRPEEIAAAVVWLCSEAAAFVVGHAMVVDGGQTV